jgi:hypothetical protein
VRLIELIAGASAWSDDDTTVYAARPWSCDADAVLVSPAPDPAERDGTLYDYFLETFIAREVIKGLIGPPDQRCQFLINYAEKTTPDLMYAFHPLDLTAARSECPLWVEARRNRNGARGFSCSTG